MGPCEEEVEATVKRRLRDSLSTVRPHAHNLQSSGDARPEFYLSCGILQALQQPSASRPEGPAPQACLAAGDRLGCPLTYFCALVSGACGVATRSSRNAHQSLHTLIKSW